MIRIRQFVSGAPDTLFLDGVTRIPQTGRIDNVYRQTIEFDLLATLCERPSMVFGRQLLLERVWGEDWFSDHHVVDVHIANLRKKIDANGTAHIKTVRGVGYRMA